MRLKKWLFPILLGVAAFLISGLYAYGVWCRIIPFYPVALVYAGMSLITFAVYHHDKRAASEDQWRVPEATLHILELFGGWPGALLAQYIFRHKLKKASYQFIFWLIVIGHGAVWYAVKNASVMCPTIDLIPKNVTSFFTGRAKVDFSDLLPSASKTRPEQPEVTEVPTPALKPEPAQPVEDIWTNAPVTEALINEPNIRRTRVIAPKQSRMLAGEIKAVSPSHGLLISLPPDIGGEGVIAPATLIGDFHRRFRIGERVDVAVKGVCMKGTHKQLDLLLVEP